MQQTRIVSSLFYIEWGGGRNQLCTHSCLGLALQEKTALHFAPASSCQAARSCLPLQARQQAPDPIAVAFFTRALPEQANRAGSAHTGNYRPVSLTSIPGKVMEQLILEVIIQVEEKKVIRSSQHGFTKGKSCLTNLIAFYDDMTGWVDEGGAVDVVCLDFSKAFDMVSRNILLGKLRKCGLDEWSGRWTENWLNGKLRGLSSATLTLLRQEGWTR